MKVTLYVTVVLATLVVVCHGDTYLQNPRGSNNRLSETTANRKNANRLFDSQNNNKGGYNTGDAGSSDAGNRPQRQYSMKYYGSGEDASSKLQVEWTNQHGCGGNSKLNCNIVIQYMCMNNGTDDDYPYSRSTKSEEVLRRVLYMKDGVSTNTQSYKDPNKNESDKSYIKRMKTNYYGASTTRGLHETVWWYDTCRYREANGGLFTADQDLNKDKVGYVTASRTRQNNNGDRSGYECPEERDYFPYWVPTMMTEHHDEDAQRTPWIDAAWLGDTDKCNYIKKNSFNNNAKYRCVLSTESDERKYGRSIDEDSCDDEGGDWVKFNSFIEVLTDVTTESACEKAAEKQGANKIIWDKLRSDDASEVCIVQAPTLECREAPWTRVNHLGNADNYDSNKNHPNASRIELDLPYFPSGDAKRCVMRLRYNISTSDYDGWNTFADSNDNDDVIENDPEVDVFGDGDGFELALNTAQTGRTFQDRSHVYQILPRTEEMAGKTIYNLNVRGKRGNIVQTFPATEYDFIPDRLVVKKNDLVHVQWTGSNSHDNNNDGDDGEGTGGTDRSNILEMSDQSENYPKTIKEAKFWDGVKSLTDPDADGTDIAIGLASAGYYCSEKGTDNCDAKYSLKGRSKNIDDKMNNAPASYFGHVLKFTKTGGMNYVCTRNNNFSNRSQKGSITVED